MAKIGQTPINSFNGVDQQIWKCTTSGDFTVRSAYDHLVNSCSMYDQRECSSARCYIDTWKSIWKMKVSNVVEMFIWRAYRDALPTKSNLFKKKILCLILYVQYVGRRRKRGCIYYGIAQLLEMHRVYVVGSLKNVMWYTPRLFPLLTLFVIE